MANQISYLSKASIHLYNGFDHCKAKSKIGLVAGATIMMVGLILCSYPGVAAFSSATLNAGIGITVISAIFRAFAYRDQRIFDQAFRDGDREIVKNYMRKPGIDVNSEYEYSIPLARAVERGDSELVAKLLERGAQPKSDSWLSYQLSGYSQSDSWTSRILDSISMGYENQFRDLKSQLDEGKLDREMFNHLSRKLEEKYLLVATELHKSGFFSRTIYRRNCLHELFYKSVEEFRSPFLIQIAKKVLQLEGILDQNDQFQGAIPDWMNDDSFSPLYIFSRLGIMNGVEVLLADSKLDINGYSPLLAACLGGHLEIVKKLISRCQSSIKPSFEMALAHGHVEVVSYLHANGSIDPQWFSEEPEEDEKTLVGLKNEKKPLYFGVCSGNPELVEFLLEKFSTIGLNQLDAALRHAALLDLSEIAGILLKRILEIKSNPIEEEFSKNIFHAAAMMGYDSFILNLVEKLPNNLKKHWINQRGNDGATPLHLAVKHGNLNAVEALIKAGAEVNLTNSTNPKTNCPHKDYCGFTPLHWAARGQSEHSYEIVQTLVYHSQDQEKYVTMKTYQGTAFDIALETRNSLGDRSKIEQQNRIVEFLAKWQVPLTSNERVIKGKGKAILAT